MFRNESDNFSQNSAPLQENLQCDIVKKNVAAIHISGRLTLLQRKLSNVLLLNAYDSLLTKPSHQIDAHTLALIVGYHSNDISRLKSALRSLAETIAEWDLLDEDGKEDWGVSALLSYAKLKNGICEYAYSPLLAQKLYDPKIYALINVTIQKNFSSSHALTLYENCYRFIRTGSTGWLSIDIFRKLMGVHDSEYYSNFKMLNSKIIKPACLEVNKTSDIFIEAETRKNGRTISDIRFLIKENCQFPMFDISIEPAIQHSKIYNELLQKGVSERLANQWILEHGEEYISEKLAYISEHSPRSSFRYLSAAIRDDYKKQGTSQQKHTKKSPSPQQIKLKEAREAQKYAEEKAKDEAIAARNERARKFKIVAQKVASRTLNEQEKDKALFIASLKKDLHREDFKRFGWKSGLNARAIFEFWNVT